jgi:hypothetical protein
MKRSVAFAALAYALIHSTAPAAEVRFRGSFTLISVKNCLARYVGETFNSAFRPAAVGDNPNITSLSQLNQYSGDVYELAGANLTLRQWITLEANGIDNLHYSFPAKIYVTQMIPAVITPDTPYLNITGLIYNMGNDPGVAGKKCVGGFRAAYFRRIESPSF